jgi:hypothetical protein
MDRASISGTCSIISITLLSSWVHGDLKLYYGGRRLGGIDDGIMRGDRCRGERTRVNVWDSERIA